RKNADAWAYRLRRFLDVARALFAPFVFLAERVGGFLATKLQTEPLFTAPVLTEEDLMELVENSDPASGLVEDEREMIHSIIEFGDTVAREVMTPRTDVYAVEVNATLQEVAKLIRDSGHTRIPVYRDTIDNIVGIVHAKDVLAALAEGNGSTLSDLIRPAYFIPESKSLQQLLSEFRSGKTQMAIVQDEFGGTAGVVTIEDLVEEIVGEIVDEYDEEETDIVQLSDGKWSVNGRMNLDDLGNALDVPFHSEEYDTVGGFVFGLFGRQPKQGESVVHENFRLTVQETDGRRVRRILIERLQDAQGEELATGVS
ncbi:MAG: HlyC/CorC family transporter, partial [Armatimonadetes bacterium]